MTRGLVIGKFMPVHNGHLALIDFASRHCDELIVSMSFKDDDPIPGDLRISWLREILRNSLIKIGVVNDNFDNETLPLNERTSLWANFISQQYGHIDVVISSEEYGEPFARHLGAQHIMFDRWRKFFPVSASLIRSKPFQNWQFIPSVVRPYFVKKVCFYGPESTGKTTMAALMAEQFQTEWVPEVAREFISSNIFTAEDIARIALEHFKRIREKTKTANKLLLCDTDAITTAVYSQHYLQTVPEIVFKLEGKVKFDLYLLFDIDVKWVADGLRDLGDQRTKMLSVFEGELKKRNIPYVIVSGDYAQRQNFVAAKLSELLAE